jgi:hypothetical protein
MTEKLRFLVRHYMPVKHASVGTRLGYDVTPTDHAVQPVRHVDYVGLARKINREHANALNLLDAYDRGEAHIVNGKLQRV